MNQIELARLASAAHEYRPDWPKQSILTSLHPFAMRAYRDVAVALAWIATDPDTKTPARLHEDGPWWLATRLPGTTANIPAHQDPLLIPDADPDDPAACAKALREGRLVVKRSAPEERIRAAAAKAKQTLAQLRADSKSNPERKTL
jgi:hypothetical protein